MRGCLQQGLYSLVVCVTALPTPRLDVKRCDCSPWRVCPVYPEPPRGRVTLGWAAVVCPRGAGHRLSVHGLHWWLVCKYLQLLYRRPGFQAAIRWVHKCGRMWAKDSLSPVFPGSSHFLPKPHSWSSGVASNQRGHAQKSLQLLGSPEAWDVP